MTVTTTKGIIKMPDAGDTLTMHVVRCEVVEGQYGEQVKFTDTRGDSLYVTRASADRQLARAGFADQELVIYGDVDGNTLVFSRDPNPKGKPYWSITRVVKEDVSHRPSLLEQARLEDERIRKAKGEGTPNRPHQEAVNIGKLPFDDAPPPTDADSPYGEPAIEHGPGPVDKAETYFQLASRVAEFQASIGKSYECPFDLASINAMTFSIWNSR